MLLNNPVEKGLLGPVALVTGSRPVTFGIPCRGGERHDSRPCETVFLYSLSPWSRILKLATPKRALLKSCPYPHSIVSEALRPAWMLYCLSCSIIFYRHLYRQEMSALPGAGDALGLRGDYSCASIINDRQEPKHGSKAIRPAFLRRQSTTINRGRVNGHRHAGPHTPAAESSEPPAILKVRCARGEARNLRADPANTAYSVASLSATAATSGTLARRVCALE